MINHPNAGFAVREAQRRELFDLAARERQARLALLGVTRQLPVTSITSRWARFAAKLPLTIRPVRRGMAPVAGPSRNGGERRMAGSRLLSRITTPGLVVRND